MDSPSQSLSDLETYLRQRLAEPLPGPDAQRRFAPRPPRKTWRPEDRPPGARLSAALIAIYPGAAGPTIPLTLRHADLPHHAGQISLPGGRLDLEETPDAAALREAHEELGLSPAHVRLIGPLSSFWVVVSNHVIFPYVGIADTRPDFRPAAREVAAVIETPIARLLDGSAVRWDRRVREGVSVHFPFFDVEGHQVWGATAMILGEFAALFDPAFGPPEPPR